MNFTAEEYQVISNALFVAKERFVDNAKELGRSIGMERLVDQFMRQATDAQRIYDKIANKHGIAG